LQGFQAFRTGLVFNMMEVIQPACYTVFLATAELFIRTWNKCGVLL